MFLPEPNVRIWLYAKPTDMRKSFNGLFSLVSGVLSENPTSGALFVFINRRKTHIKILYFDGSGFASGLSGLSKASSIIAPMAILNELWTGLS